VLITAFAGLAALLALIGVYGVAAFAVSQQAHEFGIRMAMGAAPGTLVRMVLKRASLLALAGIAVGTLAALLLTRLMTSMLYQVTPADPVVLVATCAGVFAAAVVACTVPARAAARVDPVRTLQSS
jgi:ABC-type antimicrobial peptide transport system permease subunit